MQNKANEDATRLHGLEKKMAVLAIKMSVCSKNWIQTKDKVETLRQEKLFLTQEKSQLEGIF